MGQCPRLLYRSRRVHIRVLSSPPCRTKDGDAIDGTACGRARHSDRDYRRRRAQGCRLTRRNRYGSDLLTNRFAQQLFSGQATYTADGWTGLSGINFTSTTAGNYWVALEVGATDSAIGLTLPQTAGGGTAPALAFAFNSGGGYATAGALPFGVQVDATTPVRLPAAVWLLGTGLVGLGSRARRRRSNSNH
jgi:hypothetical protein